MQPSGVISVPLLVSLVDICATVDVIWYLTRGCCFLTALNLTCQAAFCTSGVLVAGKVKFGNFFRTYRAISVISFLIKPRADNLPVCLCPPAVRHIGGSCDDPLGRNQQRKHIRCIFCNSFASLPS